MASNLDRTMRHIFSFGGDWERSFANPANSINSRSAYMEVTIDSPTFELPIFMANVFSPPDRRWLYSSEQLENYLKDGKGTIVAKLNTENRYCNYSSFAAIMKEVLEESFSRSRLVRVVTKQGENLFEYYATLGAIFDSNFDPVLLCTWTIERYEDDGTFKCRLIQPIVRINPECFINRSNPIERFISGKFAQTALSITCNPPRTLTNGKKYNNKVLVEINKIPFKIKHADIPSISTTNEELIQLVKDNIDDIT